MPLWSGRLKVTAVPTLLCASPPHPTLLPGIAVVTNAKAVPKLRTRSESGTTWRTSSYKDEKEGVEAHITPVRGARERVTIEEIGPMLKSAAYQVVRFSYPASWQQVAVALYSTR